MMLTNLAKKIKYLTADVNTRSLSILIILASITSFGAIRLLMLAHKKIPLTILDTGGNQAGEPQNTKITPDIGERPQNQKGNYIASKNGKFYHYPWCSGGVKIKEENMLRFNTKAEAEKAGFKPASNCPGL